MRTGSLSATFIGMILLAGCQGKNPPKPNVKADNAKTITHDKLSVLEATVVDPTMDASDNNEDAAIETTSATHKSPLTIIIDNLKSEDAPVEVSIFGPKNKFLDKDDHLKRVRFKPKNGKLVAKVNGLPYGDLAMALYQDINSNGKIDKNVVGIPKEPYAFSNNYRPKMKAPSFNNCKFIYNAAADTVHVTFSN
jgi:uncharacterized protein (DUF2141 family)